MQDLYHQQFFFGGGPYYSHGIMLPQNPILIFLAPILLEGPWDVVSKGFEVLLKGSRRVPFRLCFRLIEADITTNMVV